MDQSLRDAAQQGSIDALYELIQGDPNVLDRIDEIPFVETPLHTVASVGHTRFAMEIMRLKPSFARKLNQDGFTPLHLALQKLHALENDQALQKKQTQLVYRLVSVDKDLVRVQGREGVTPLHYVAQIGNLDLLSTFLIVCPTSIKDVTIGEETVLHIALINNHLHAFEYLIRWLQCTTIEDAEFWETTLLNWKDEEDNTVLHIAVSNNQPQEENQDHAEEVNPDQAHSIADSSRPTCDIPIQDSISSYFSLHQHMFSKSSPQLTINRNHLGVNT